jgi:hypothetical protein
MTKLHNDSSVSPPAAEAKITAWTKLEGADLITLRGDGGIDFAGYGRRSALTSGLLPGAENRLQVRATAIGGPSYEILVHAGLSHSDRLCGYAVELDSSYRDGMVLVRLVGEGGELSVPIAEAPFPKGFAWEGTEHLTEIEVRTDSMTVRLDGVDSIEVLDLGLAAARAILAASVRPSDYQLPAANGCGITTSHFTQLRVAGVWTRPLGGATPAQSAGGR